jgi:hypothetical protein
VFQIGDIICKKFCAGFVPLAAAQMGLRKKGIQLLDFWGSAPQGLKPALTLPLYARDKSLAYKALIPVP